MMVRASRRSARRLTAAFRCCAAAAALSSSSSPVTATGASRLPISSAAFVAFPRRTGAIPSSTPNTTQQMSSSASGVRDASEHPSEASAASGHTAPTVAANLASVRARIDERLEGCNRPAGSVRLVAVSKTKPVEMVMEAYEAGQRVFGENYAQELMAKAEEMPSDVAWHFIGPLQSNKAGPLVKKVGLDRLKCIETVSTLKLAKKLNRAAEDGSESLQGGDDGEEGGDKTKRLGIYLQVNTSGESTKSGVPPGEDLLDLASSVASECPRLRIDGLMTIGAPGDLSCFDILAECREEVARTLGLRDPTDLELSMGMSGDFESAIERGATSVRVGSTIFGARDYSDRKGGGGKN